MSAGREAKRILVSRDEGVVPALRRVEGGRGGRLVQKSVLVVRREVGVWGKRRTYRFGSPL